MSDKPTNPLNKSLESELTKSVFAVVYAYLSPFTAADPSGLTKELVALIQSELKNQRDEIRKRLAGKKRNEKQEEKTMGINPQYSQGYNVAIDQITKTLDGIEEGEDE